MEKGSLFGVEVDQVTALVLDGQTIRIERGTLGTDRTIVVADRYIGVDEKRAAREERKPAPTTRLRIAVSAIVGVECVEEVSHV